MTRNYFPIILMTVLMGLSNEIFAQTYVGTEGLTIKTGTELSLDGFLIVPSQDLELKDNTLTKTETAIKWPVFSSINAVYHFKNPFSYSGELGLVSENDALNGNVKSNLKIAFAKAVSGDYNDFSILNSTLVSGDLILSRFTNPYVLGSLTAVSRESDVVQLVKPENFFSPNGDGINDQWVIQDIQLYPNNQVSVYDRAGRVVFQMMSYDNSWTGMYNGSLLAKGTYYYTIRLKDTIPLIKGSITIVR